jgi:hypothetical protein
MKKLLGVAAAALMLSAGAASAAPTKVTVSVFGYSCTFSVYKQPSTVAGKVLLTATDPGQCNFVGAGDISKVKGIGPVATIAGSSGLLPSGYTVLTVLDYPFVSGGTYRAYYTSDGKALNYLGSGTYTVE